MTLVIGDTPAQLGQIEAADAMMIDGKIVTRDDYRALVAQVAELSKYLSVYEELQKLTPPKQNLAEVRAKAVEDAADFLMDYLRIAKEVTWVTHIALREYANFIRKGVR